MPLVPPITGRCHCGALRYRIDSAPLWQAHCHCDSCRRATSSPFTSYFGIRNGTFTWEGEPPATYMSSPGTWRDFCPHCGSPMTYRSDQFPNETHFFAASLDDPTAYTPTLHVHTDEMLPWVHLADGLPRR